YPVRPVAFNNGMHLRKRTVLRAVEPVSRHRNLAVKIADAVADIYFRTIADFVVQRQLTGHTSGFIALKVAMRGVFIALEIMEIAACSGFGAAIEAYLHGSPLAE